MKTCLLDTGPVVAYFDPSDPDHEMCQEVLDSFVGQFITTSAVIGEAMHFLIDFSNGPALFIEFLKVSNTKVVECCQPDNLQRAVQLMNKYNDTPMDFADATLVLLGGELNLHQICTLDRRGFSTFRTATGKRFNLVIDRV